MAAKWKENGVVLDSDDEDEDFDSQETTSDEPVNGEENGEFTREARENAGSDSEDELAKDGYGLQFAGEAEEIRDAGERRTPRPYTASNVPDEDGHGLGDRDVTGDIERGRTLSGDAEVTENIARERTSSGDEPSRLSETPPARKKVFKVPECFLSPDGRYGSVENGSASGMIRSESQPELPKLNDVEVDEISKSYVQISSPLSSPSLPLPDTPIRKEGFSQTSAIDELRSSPTQLPKNSGDHLHNVDEDVLMPDFLPSQHPLRRPLRPRTAVQTNPYTLEQALYRTKLFNAGLKPVNVAPDEEERSGQEEDSQDTPFETEEDSQLADFIAVDQPSSQPQPVFGDDSDDEPLGPLNPVKDSALNTNLQQVADEEDDPFRPFSDREGAKSPHPNNNDNENLYGDDDSDELPDITSILKRRNGEAAQRSAKRKRPRTYKTNRSMSATSRTNNTNGRDDNMERDVYDFPPSPPITSSNSLSEPTRSLLGRVSSVSTRISSPLNRTGNDQPRASEIPTPALSGAMRYAGIVPLDLSSEDEDEENQISSAGMSRASSREPDDRVRRVGKRIRGVLPASWLRLDQKPPSSKPPPPLRRRDSESAPPERNSPQRGVAVRRLARDNTPSTSGGPSNPYFLDAESESDDGNDIHGITAAHDNENFGTEASQFDQSLADSLFGDAIEDDRVDRMLPSRKRSSTGPNHRPSKKRRVSSNLFRGNDSGYARQPKITEQFNRARDSPIHAKNPRPNDSHSGAKTRRRKPARKTPVKKFVPPKLSILDVTNSGSRASSPAFIRIASRTARSRRQLGRHSPNRKFIRLDNIDDTNDAQSVLREWREGTILPNKSLRYEQALPISARRHSLDQQTILPPPLARGSLHVPERAPRRLVLSKGQQTTLDGVVRNVAVETRDLNRSHSAVYHHLPSVPKKGQPLHNRPHAQPAQLETEEREYNRSHPNADFGTTKKGLDKLWRRAHKGAPVKGDMQLARFLADPDAVGSVVDDMSYQEDVPLPEPEISEVRPPRPSRRRKGSPRHIDAGAHKYRQPSEPLPLDNYFVSADVNSTSSGKLVGLQPYGTRYTYHFDIFPLQSGIFFHETTFIGSGRLARALDVSFPHRDYWVRCMPCSYHLDEKQLQWAEWDGNISSEMGLCFDWIAGQLETPSPDASVPELMDFIMKYVEQHLFFVGQDDQKHFIRRVCDIMDGFLTRAPENIQNAVSGMTTQQTIEILARLLALLMQLLRMCHRSKVEISLTRGVESSLQRASERCAALLVSLGLDKVRDFYEDCQYLSSRVSGVRKNRYYIEAWVILMKVMQEAKIPRSSFWDIVNKPLLSRNLDTVGDAQVFERVWYNMFSLIPLTEFDDSGVVRPGLRHAVSMDNWALPQKLMKRVFTMYTSKSRQSAGFNDYVRSLFVRCHHLMVEWGWRRYGSIIGTLFDFFATHNLAHLRNEECYSSPRFLEELDTEPSLSVEAEDKCFHIFLKIVATSIKHMRQAGDTKGIRNLVARLLPNHDRQYPKDEAIHQRDLASLRNHHDLLCTLFWAAPAGLRPSIGLLQKLVIPELSHKEACLINLRAWSNLSKFLLATSPVPEEYQKLVSWQQDVFAKLVKQYETAEEEIRQQHAALSDTMQQLHSEQTICDTIDRNKEQAIEEISCHLRAITLHLKDSKDVEVAETVFIAGRSLVTSVFGLFNSNTSAQDRIALETALHFVEHYFSKTEQYQRSLPVLEYEEREALILSKPGCLSVFDDKFLESLEKTVALMLEQKLNVLDEKLIVEVWAKVSACRARHEDFFKNKITILQTRVGAWISGDAYPASASKEAQTYAPLFMAVFLEQVPEPVFKRATMERDMFQEWLCSIARPTEQFRFEFRWTQSLVKAQQLPAALLRDSQPYLPRHIVSLKYPNRSRVGQLFDDLSILKMDQFTIIEGAIKFISDTHKDKKSTDHQTRRSQSKILERLMATLKDQYTSAFKTQTTASINYQQFVRQVISSIKTYANDVCPLDKFFTEPGTIYYHSTSDGPNFFVPIMINHGLRIPDKGENPLLYYCWESIKGMVRRQETQRLQGLLLQVMDYDLKSNDTDMGATKAIIMRLAPAAVWAAWQCVEGFVIADLFLGVVEEQVLVVAGGDIGVAAEMVLPVVRCAVQGVWGLFSSNTPDIHPPHLYLLTRVIRFMTALWDVLVMASTSIPDLPALLQQFTSFIKAAAIFYDDKERIGNEARFYGHAIAGQEAANNTPAFGNVLRDEYVENWSYRDGSVWVHAGFGARVGEVLVGAMGGGDVLAGEEVLVGGLVDALGVCCEVVGVGREGVRRRDLGRAVVGLEDVGL